MQLNDWIAAEGITLEALAVKLGTNTANVWRWANGECMPRPEWILKIAATTAGQVGPSDWYPTAEAVVEAFKKWGRDESET